MPSKNIIKTYVDGGYYHIYNRGVNKDIVFGNKKDYSTFLSYLKSYLLPTNRDALMTVLSDPESSQKEKEQVKNELKRNDFSDTIDLLAYCLMPNHYHFLVKVKEGRALEKFMKSLMTRYTKYFNTRYDRVGPLFQGRYKAVLVENDEQLLYLTRYIHRNPISQKTPKQQGQGQSLLWEKVILTQPTSYPVYVKKFEQSWVKPGDILGNFAKSGFNSYESFVADQDFHVMDMETYFLEYLQ